MIHLSNVTRQHGSQVLFRDASFQILPGTHTGLVGPNGAGKTTIFNLVSGFYQPTSGMIRIGGVCTAGLKPHQVTARGVARTFQNIRLWHDMTVLDNIRVAQHHCLGYGFFHSVARSRRYREREATIEREARELLEVFQLTPFADDLPKNLPYGTQRKLEIARALSVKPKLLLLDEPAAGLNAADIRELVRLVRWVQSHFQVTIWMIEHHMDVMMELCERIKVIDFGETIAEGTPAQIRSHPAVISAYLGDETL